MRTLTLCLMFLLALTVILCIYFKFDMSINQ